MRRRAKRPDSFRRSLDLRFAGKKGLSDRTAWWSRPSGRACNLRFAGASGPVTTRDEAPMYFVPSWSAVRRGRGRAKRHGKVLEAVECPFLYPVRRRAEAASTSALPQLAVGSLDEASCPTVCPVNRLRGLVPLRRAGRTLPDLRFVGGPSGGELEEHRNAGRSRTESFGRRAGTTCVWNRFSACRESGTHRGGGCNPDQLAGPESIFCGSGLRPTGSPVPRLAATGWSLKLIAPSRPWSAESTSGHPSLLPSGSLVSAFSSVRHRATCSDCRFAGETTSGSADSRISDCQLAGHCAGAGRRQ